MFEKDRKFEKNSKHKEKICRNGQKESLKTDREAKWCKMHKTGSHSDGECMKQRTKN